MPPLVSNLKVLRFQLYEMSITLLKSKYRDGLSAHHGTKIRIYFDITFGFGKKITH